MKASTYAIVSFVGLAFFDVMSHCEAHTFTYLFPPNKPMSPRFTPSDS